MRTKHALLFALALSLLGMKADARFAHVETQQVPVARLLTNLEARLKSTTLSKADRSALQFQIGRLHSMAYALKTEEVQVQKASAQGPGEPTPWFGYCFSDYNQFDVQRTGDKTKLTSANEHLATAVQHLRAAAQGDPNSLHVKLGLAWALDQSGNKREALPLYRQVFNESFKQEQDKSGLAGTSVTEETGGYLKKMLDPQKDAAELKDIEEKLAKITPGFRNVTPIVVPLFAGVPRSTVMKQAQVTFDLDGNGPRRYSTWTSSQAGWLVYDARKHQDITSGLQMFGQCTFWIFWKDGYEALSALDDNHDGTINGAETSGLAIWRDANCNGVSEPDEVKSLETCGIKSLSCKGENDPQGFRYSVDGVTFESGAKAHSYDLILRGQ